MAEPSEIKSQVNRTRENSDPAAFSPKPVLDEKNKGAGLRGGDKKQGDLQQPAERPPDSDTTGGVGSQGGL
ncbi:MAG: hypothetical protein QOF91_3342 [Alphaproteobacteria bacterium]|jgi:hypothetical protein|nr:hypothetical protein [Alphaproteobacteria bacterium]